MDGRFRVYAELLTQHSEFRRGGDRLILLIERATGASVSVESGHQSARQDRPKRPRSRPSHAAPVTTAAPWIAIVRP